MPKEVTPETSVGSGKRVLHLYFTTAAFLLILLAIIMPVYNRAMLDGLILIGPDDYTRLSQTLDFMAGASWFDLHAERIAPPDGLWLHISRLPDLPVAAALWLGGLFSDQAGAIRFTMVAVPILTGVCLVLALYPAARIVGGRHGAPLVPLLMVMAGAILLQLAPGRLDHHGWQLVLMAGSLSALAVALTSPQGRWAPVAAGVLHALSVGIGLETLPYIVVINAVLAVFWLYRPQEILPLVQRYGAAFLLGTLGMFLLSVPPQRYFVEVCDAISLTHVAAAAAVPLAWYSLGHAGGRIEALSRPAPAGLVPRLVAVTGTAVVLAGVLYILFPHCFTKPLGLDSELEQRWLAEVGEARSISKVIDYPVTSIMLYGPVVIGLVAFGYILFRPGHMRRPQQLCGTLLVAASVFTLWQLRGGIFASLFALPVTARFLGDLFKLIDARIGMPWRVFPKTALALAVAPPFYTVIVAALQTIPDADANMVGAPPEEAFNGECSHVREFAYIASLPPGRVMTFLGLGPQIMLHTPHSIISAPIHRNREGIRDTLEFFSARSSEAARAIVERRGVDYVVICRNFDEAGTYLGGDEPTFFDHIIAGDLPDWLEASSTEESSGSKARLEVFSVHLLPPMASPESAEDDTVKENDDGS